MKLIVVVFVMAASAASKCIKTEPDGLVLVHTMFRHGNRTIADNIYPTNPYGDESFYMPYGYEQLTAEGKRTEYYIGKYLRDTYGDLLGSTYYPGIIEARSTVTDRTKMSMQLVLANLFRPDNETVWNPDLNWQPIPYNTFDELSGRKICTNYKPAYKKYIKTDAVLELLEPYQELFDFVSEQSGLELQKAKKVAYFYIELRNQAAFGYPVPDWLALYDEALYNVSALNYRLLAGKKKLKKLSSGYFLRKLIEDTENRALDPDLITKMFLYAAHETNIATLLVTMGLYDDKLPQFGSHLIFEVHSQSGVYGLKIFYQNWEETEPKLLILPGCDEFCPINTFKELMADWIPDDSYCELGDNDDGDDD